ncbi:MAG: GAF domain-containing protein [Spirulina sp. SIO3F2]|nr:GAF domain-containing protein [Spirulina sp. SIO3F2]
MYTASIFTGYNLPLVALSIAIAIFAAYTALDLGGRVTATEGKLQLIWLAGGALVMGTGIWSMHFVGMLAFKLPLSVQYHVPIVLLSVLPAVITSGLALFVVSRPQLLRWQWVGGSLLMGSGIVAMHYVGMLAMHTSAMMSYDWHGVLLSVGVAIAVSGVGLLLIFQLRIESEATQTLRKISAAVIMGSAIPLTHYIGMAAVRYQVDSHTVLDQRPHSPENVIPLASTIIIGTLMMLGITVLTAFFERRLAFERTYNQILQENQARETLLNHLSHKIRQSLDLQAILQTTVCEVRKFFESDRALIYQFDQDWCGTVILEDVTSPWQATLGEAADDCFPHALLTSYSEGRIHSINDSLTASIHPQHRELLQHLQVRANLIVPIIVQNKLWGLLMIHQCDRPRNWQDSEGQLLYRLAIQLGIAIQQSELYTQAEKNTIQAQQQAADLQASEIKLKQKTETLQATLDDVRNLQNQLIQTEKMSSLGQLVAGIAHEINNPVNFIYGNLSHLQSYTHDLLKFLDLYQHHCPQPNPEISEHAEQIEIDFLRQDIIQVLNSMAVGTERIREIVLSLRNFSRVDEADFKRVNIHDGIDSTLMILNSRFKSHGDCPEVKVLREYGNLPLVECFPGSLNQVLMNIIDNAIDSFEETRQESDLTCLITIKTTVVNEHWIQITIADNGSGIPESVQTQIFNPFFTTKPVGKGTGMGLAISYQIIVEKHCGQINCRSTLGEGTTFEIRIPIQHTATMNG